MEKSEWGRRRRELSRFLIRKARIQQADTVSLDGREKGDQAKIRILPEFRFLCDFNGEKPELDAELVAIGGRHRHQTLQQLLRRFFVRIIVDQFSRTGCMDGCDERI